MAKTNTVPSLQILGEQIRARRKMLGISSVVTAEAAGISRITLYRIERGEASVAMGAYLSVIQSLGLTIELGDSQRHKLDSTKTALPQKINISDYPQLKKMAWQLKANQQLSPQQVLDLYERNWRHIDFKKMDAREKLFLESLLHFFARERLLV